MILNSCGRLQWIRLSADTMSFFEFSIRKWEDCKVQWRSFKGFLRRITRKTAR
ncbi:MAG: hypothetical protein V6S10_04775 [Candidatus Methanoglobus sp.]